ncbi:MAG: (2Fe-2S)-binding protein [Desulfobulbales bacterium]|nr:(2Fe-2S)-binding protein [Desulfobulbales bacterium]
MDSEELKKQWLLQNEKICICNAIPRKQIVGAIKNGAASLQEINRSVGSGSGECKGKRCGPRIKKLLTAYRTGGKKSAY